MNKIQNSKKSRHAFSLLEVSVVLLMIGIIIAGITSSSRIIKLARVARAAQQTKDSPVNQMDSVSIWLEPTLKKSFEDYEIEDTATTTNDGISVWYDSNPNPQRRRNAVIATVSPHYYQSCINSLPCIRFDGDSYLIIDPDGLENHDYSIFVIEQRRASGHNPFFGTLNSPSSNNSIAAGYNSSDAIYLAQGSQTSIVYEFTPSMPAYSSPTPVLHSFINSSLMSGSTQIEHFLNGSSSASSSSVTGSFAGLTSYTDLIIGASHNDTNLSYFDGDIGEIIFFKKPLSKTERRSVEHYLLNKWNIERAN